MECHSTPRSSCQRKIACEVSSVPLSETIMSGRPHSSTILSSSLTTCWPDKDVSRPAPGTRG